MQSVFIIRVHLLIIIVYSTRLNDAVDLGDSELRLQTVRERELEQQLKKLQDELTQVKADSSYLHQQLKQSQSEVKQRDDLIKKGDVRERELDQQLQQSAQRKQKLKDEISHLQQQLRNATDRKTSLQCVVKFRVM